MVGFAAALLAAMSAAPSPAEGKTAAAWTSPEATAVETYIREAHFPVDMAWQLGTRTIFFTEKNTGKIRVAVRGRLLRRPCARLDVESSYERGALGIALHPEFEQNRYLYVYYSSGAVRDNRVARFVVDDNNRCRQKTVLIKGIPAAKHHQGGQIEFLDGYMFVSTGDVRRPWKAQNTAITPGKVLRYNADGSIPEDNPFTSPEHPNPVWSYGHRNAFGLAARPGTSQLFESENGTTCGDEINLIEPGRNYGWGMGFPENCQGAGVGPDPIAPIYSWTQVIAPTDLTWYRGRIDALYDTLVVGDWITGSIRSLRLSADGRRVESAETFLRGSAPISDVHEGPGGWLYFLTMGSIKRIVEVPTSDP